MKKKIKLRNISIILFFIIFTYILSSFNFQDTYVGSWNPQYVYNTNGKSLIDIAFADSLTGYMTLRKLSLDAPCSILKTTNGGDNWFISKDYPSDSAILKRINLINKDSVLICEGFSLIKTTNGGQIWIRNNFPGFLGFDIHAFNLDTIWIGAGTGFNQPQMYLTTDGGTNWTLKFQLSSGVEFSRVYFYNKRIGFCCTGSNTYKTTNGGDNWFQLIGEKFTKMIFADSLTGWKCDAFNYAMKKTTDGGYNWVTQILPSGGVISDARMYDFDVINKDTLWGCGGRIFHSPPPNRIKGIIYKTTNGGLNWGYQLPDTNIVKYSFYDHIKFYGKNYGWAYESDSGSGIRMGGVHTVTGGLDTTIYTNIKEQITNNASQYELFQNYPNPFNQFTIINVQLKVTKQIRLNAYDITGRLIKTIINQKQNSGIHSIKFDGSNLSSGIYYYALFVNGIWMDAKKMVLLK